jgi:hypothetical protein
MTAPHVGLDTLAGATTPALLKLLPWLAPLQHVREKTGAQGRIVRARTALSNYLRRDKRCRRRNQMSAQANWRSPRKFAACLS